MRGKGKGKNEKGKDLRLRKEYSNRTNKNSIKAY